MDIGTVKPVQIEEEMRSSYLDYAMSVIISRALPDVRDGLKPVQRRILYAMADLGLRYNTPYRKSARIVGEVLGRYHPHGDAPVYEAMVRMAQEFSLRYMLVDGQGNFGSIDNDPPAAMRYTEARLAQIASELLADIDKDTVDFAPNFDGTAQEPSVLPARFPNLLVNGASGIAVGMATNIPPHNLGEILDCLCHLIDSPGATVEDLMTFIKGPDFPTGALIRGQQGIRDAYTTGRGRIVLQARVGIEEAKRGGRNRIVVTELPYQTNKAALVERIADLVREKRLEGISEVRDESDREGIRLVVELKRDAQPELVRQSLFKYTPLQTSFFVNMLALVDGVPRVLNLKAALQQHISFRQQVLERRSRFELARARERAHILEGFKIALDNLDQVINTIRASPSAEEARSRLMASFSLSQAQAQAILEMQLRRLAALEREKILEEYREVMKTIASLEDLLAHPEKFLLLIKEEALALKEKYGDARRTQISGEEAPAFTQEDLIPPGDMVITLSQRGYVKRLAPETYRLQHRGGKGVTAMGLRGEDSLQLLAMADTHDRLLFLTNQGRVLNLKCYQLPGDSSRESRGHPLVNLLSLEAKEQAVAILPLPHLVEADYLVLATRRGLVKKVSLAEFGQVKALIALKLRPRDELAAGALAGAGDQLLLFTEKGRALRFPLAEVPSQSRYATGVRGFRLEAEDRVMALVALRGEGEVLLLSRNGFGKRTPVKRFTLHHRGGGGLRAFRVVRDTGPLAAACLARPGQELLTLSAGGSLQRLPLDEVPVLGRDARGVRVMGFDSEDFLVSAIPVVLRQG